MLYKDPGFSHQVLQDIQDKFQTRSHKFIVLQKHLSMLGNVTGSGFRARMFGTIFVPHCPLEPAPMLELRLSPRSVFLHRVQEGRDRGLGVDRQMVQIEEEETQ